MIDEHGRCVVPSDTGAIVVGWPGVELAVAFAPPKIDGRCAAEGWRHQRREQGSRTLGGCEGRWVRDELVRLGVRLDREVWFSGQRREFAIRHTVTNLGPRELSLDELLPLHGVGPETLRLDGVPAGRWEVLRQARLKNDIPAAVRLGTFDEDYDHATRTIGEHGDLPTDDLGRGVGLTLDSFGLLRPTDHASRTHLLIGFLSQRDHLAQIELETDPARRRLARLSARCLFDGCAVPPGGQRSSQWVIVMGGERAPRLIQRFADRVGCYHGVAVPTTAPPSVWCSWYYYGPYFYEPDLHTELAYLESHRLPFDVLLIDDSRPRPWGDWLSHPHWPSGMKDAARRIARLGYRPGIWTCPLLAHPDSRLAADHPDWLLRRDDGQPVCFEMEGVNHVLDPTRPGVEHFLEELFRTMTRDWGFTYHKLDFMRAVFIEPRSRPHDRAVTRLQAYQRALEAIRRGAGPDAYISVCGGHYGGSLGLVDSQRSGADVVASWDDPPALPAIKQNLLRTWMNRFWHTDADSMMVRRRERPINDTRHGRLSMGRFTDEEARTIAANQYVAGGIVCATESFSDIEADRLALYRHVIPTLGSPGVPLDPMHPRCPTMLLNRVEPRCAELGHWFTLTVFNWKDRPADVEAPLREAVRGDTSADRWLVTEFFGQRLLGVMRPEQTVTLKDVPPHGCRVLRIAPWRGDRPVLAGTDLHFSGGGVEVSAWRCDRDQVSGVIDTRWTHPVRVMAAFPEEGRAKMRWAVVEPADRTFRIAAVSKVPAARV